MIKLYLLIYNHEKLILYYITLNLKNKKKNIHYKYKNI